MAFIIKDRVKENTTTTGTGAISLGGAAATFDTFQSYMVNGDTTYYAIVSTETNTDEWEVGLGTWNTGNTLTRTTVLTGSNGTNAVDFGSGNKDVFMTYPAAHAALAGDDVDFANITVSGTVDGRDVAADGTKLDTIETNADVTDAVNVAAAGALMKSGGTMTGALILNADPTTALGAATKEYVDTIAAAGIHYHTPVRVESPDTAGNLNATYDNGTSGVGATLTNAGTQAALVIDGVTLNTNDRVLIYSQTNAYENGIYTVTNTGSASTNWVLTRATDADSYGASDPNALGEGDAYFVKEGNTGAGELYVMNTSGVITFGTTAINFTVIAETAVYSAGTGLTLTGTTFSIGQDVGTTANVTFNQVTAAIIGNVTGNVTGNVSGNAGTATKLATARTIQLSGDVTGSASFDGSANINITAAVQDDSHAHVISNVDGLQAALDDKVPTTRTLTAGNGLTGGGDLSANRTFSVGAGSGITVGADTVSHAATSSQASVNNSGRTYIQDITLDPFGHVTGLTSATETVTNTNQLTTFQLEDGDGTEVTISHGKEVKFVEGGGIDINWTDTDNGTDGDPYDLTFTHADTSNQASVDNSNGTVIQDVTLDGYGHVTGLGSVDLDSRYVNVTGDTMTGDLTINSSGLAASPNLKINNSSASTFNHSLEAFTSNMTANQSNILVFGKSGNTKNSGYIGYNWAANASNNNYVSIGHWGSDHLFRVYADGVAKVGINTVFHDGYHPNADKWTTARSHTVTLTGDVTGTATQSVDGTNDKTWTIITAVGDNSHSHSIDTITDEHRLFNNMGDNHSTRTDFNTSYNFGWRYVQGTVNGPGTGGSQFYTVYAGLGNEYPATGTSSYGMQIAYPRNTTDPYINIRYRENNSWGSWTKAAAGSADKWRTARTHTVTLTGEVTGTASQTVDGTGNKTWSIATTINNSALNDQYVNITGDTMTGVLTINNTADAQLLLQSSDSWTGIGFNDSGGTDQYIWYNGSTGTFAIGGGGSIVAGKKLHVDGGMSVGSSSDGISTPTEGIYSEGGITIGAAIGSRDKTLSIDGDANSSPIVIQCDTVDNAWGILPWVSGETYIHGGVYYDDGSWVHRSSNTTNYLLRLNGGTGAGWYASNNSSGSWNVANNVSLWNNSGTWIGAVAKSPTLTLSGDASGSATFTNLGNATLSVTVANDSHTHLWSNIVGNTRQNYSLVLKPADSTNYAGFQFYNTAGSSAGYFLIAGSGVNNTTYQPDGITLVADTGWLSLVSRTTSNTGVRISTGTTPVVRQTIDSSGNINFTSSSVTIDGGTSTTLSVKCDNAGLALIRANGDDQGTGAVEVGQSNSYGGGISYNGDNSPAFASGETADNITFYRMEAGARTEVFSYPYNSNNVTFNGYTVHPNIYLADAIYHDGDTNTYMQFNAADSYRVVVGGTERVTVNSTGVRVGNTNNGYFQGVGGEYGSIQIDGGAKNGWEGYSIGGRVVFMHENSNAMGLYDDVYNHWKFYAILNGASYLGYQGIYNKLETTSTGVTVNGDLNSTSDIRYKKNIETIDNALDKVQSLRGVTFDWDHEDFDTTNRATGVIAQDVEKVLPEAVRENEDGFKNVAYGNMVGLLIEAIKEQQEQIDMLTQKLNEMENK